MNSKIYLILSLKEINAIAHEARALSKAQYGKTNGKTCIVIRGELTGPEYNAADGAAQVHHDLTVNGKSIYDLRAKVA